MARAPLRFWAWFAGRGRAVRPGDQGPYPAFSPTLTRLGLAPKTPSAPVFPQNPAKVGHRSPSAHVERSQLFLRHLPCSRALARTRSPLRRSAAWLRTRDEMQRREWRSVLMLSRWASVRWSLRQPSRTARSLRRRLPPCPRRALPPSREVRLASQPTDAPKSSHFRAHTTQCPV